MAGAAVRIFDKKGRISVTILNEITKMSIKAHPFQGQYQLIMLDLIKCFSQSSKDTLKRVPFDSA